MNTTWRTAGLTTGALLCAVGLTACGATGPATSSSPKQSAVPAALNKPVTITYWERYCDEGITDAVKRFNEENRNKITVKHVCAGSDETALAAKIQSAAAGGGLPDIATASEQYAAQYNQAHLLQPLDPYLASHWGVSAKEKSDFFPGAIDRTKLKVYGNQTMSWPFASTANALYVNMDLLHKAGIKQPPTTWQEFQSDAQTIKRATGKPGWVTAPGDGADLLDAIWSSGTPWVDAAGTKAQLDAPTTVGVLRSWQSMFHNGSAVVSGNYKSSFTSGQAGMVFASTGYATTWSSDMKNADWQIAMFPHAQGQPPLTELFGSAHVVFHSTPQRQLAAWLFAKYMASAQNQALMCPGQGCIPATQSSIANPAINDAIKSAPQYGTAINDIAPHAHLLPQSTALASVRGEIAADVFTKVTSGKLTPQQGAKELQNKAQQAIDSAQ
ncbi:extracellular solute-binding protein [Streptomyces chiangmaiensis]|uniref:Extracellular solute-binding protein n=1 Tax=Streptomyces chiangmaiensis TaxID=766497 RepID=A0ABU7FUC7_9ACTN|nr:extracellular solute-binding protein [Streptomyces chiangmaiensis]MED7827133.1 extracellular solute-binding protein [Streptomyces chiangmaiensis]